VRQFGRATQTGQDAGFRGSSWKTLETGCGNEIELHFVDATTAEFGLYDFVYVLKKE
jgi:hypothetical protein